MIEIDAAYVIPFETTAAGLPVAADATPTAVLWRNGSAEPTAIVIVTTANTGIYHATFTTDDEWLPTDRLWLIVSATIDGDAYTSVAWDSFGESDSKADIATAVVEKVVSDSNPVGSVGYWLAALGSMIEFVGGLWRWKASSLSEAPTESGIGQYQITLVADSIGGQVSGVVFRIAGTVLNVTTGSSGEAVLNLDAGSYTLRTVVPPGYEQVADQALVVAGDATEMVTVVATSVTISSPPLCSVSLPIVDQYGAPIAGVNVMIEFVSFDDSASPDAVVLSPPPVLTSDEDGMITVDLLRLGNYKASYAINGAVKRVDFSVPDAGSYVVVEPN